MNMSDIKLYVSRIGYTKKSDLANNMEDIEEKKIENIHMLINGSHELNSKYGKYGYNEKSATTNLLNKKVGQFRKKTAAF